MRVETWSGLVLLLATLVSAVAAFTGLTADGLWTDELFTAYFADPAMTSAGEVVIRGAEDVHPPGYYLLTWAVARAAGADFDLVARGLSAALGVLALAVIFMAPGRGVGAVARLVAVAFVATSTMWFEYTHEVRSYTLVFVIVGALAGLALRADARLRAGGTAAAALAATAVAGAGAGLVHYYTTLVSGGVFAVLLLLSARTWPARIAVAVAGLSVLAVVAGFVAWHLPRIVVDVGDTHFQATPGFIAHMTRSGIRLLAGDRLDQAALAAIVVVVLAAWIAARTRWPIDRAPALLIGAAILASVFGVALTMLVTPMYSFRLFAVLAPLLWVALAHVMQGALDRLGRPGADARLRQGALVALAATIALSAMTALERGERRKMPWRESARAVASLEGCLSANIPIIWWEQPYFSEDDPDRFHGYYLPNPNEVIWLSIPRDELERTLEGEAMRRLVRDTESGARDCPILLWEIHSTGGLRPPQKVALMEALLDYPGTSVTIRRIRNTPPIARLYLLE